MGRKSLFGVGYEAAHEEEKRIAAARANSAKVIWRLFLKPSEEKVIHFLTEEPVTFYEHTIPAGKDKYDNVLCSGDECIHCESGNRASFKGAFLVYDKTPFKDKNGTAHKGTLRLYVTGTTNVTKLDRQHTKYGLTNREYTIVRVGKGKSTSYEFERGEETGRLSRKRIAELLPEVYADMYNGTAESLYDIVKAALEAEAESNESVKTRPEKVSDDYDEEYDGEDYESDDDFEDDNDYVDSEDDEEELYERPAKPVKKTLSRSRSSAKSLFKNRKR